MWSGEEQEKQSLDSPLRLRPFLPTLVVRTTIGGTGLEADEREPGARVLP
jgi:hypothetical protein